MTTPVVDLIPTRVTWARVESGFHVASRSGEFLGYVDQTSDGSYLAFDGRSTPVGRYDSLREAQKAVTSVPTSLPSARAKKIARVFRPAAAITGVVAGGLALTAGAFAPYL